MDQTHVAASASMGHAAELPEGAGVSRSGWREAQEVVRNQTVASIERKEREVAAASAAVDRAKEPAVPRPTLSVPRGRPASANALGCCLTSGAHLAELEAVREAQELKEAEKARKADEYWDRWRPRVRAAEEKLREHGTPSKLSVADLNGLVVSRTGHCAKAKSNKENALLDEARAAVAVLGSASVCPSTPGGGGGAAGTGGGDGGEHHTRRLGPHRLAEPRGADPPHRMIYTFFLNMHLTS